MRFKQQLLRITFDDKFLNISIVLIFHMRVPDTTVLDRHEKIQSNPNNTLLVLDVGFSPKENIILIYHITLFPHKEELTTVLAQWSWTQLGLRDICQLFHSFHDVLQQSPLSFRPLENWVPSSGLRYLIICEEYFLIVCWVFATQKPNACGWPL